MYFHIKIKLLQHIETTAFVESPNIIKELIKGLAYLWANS